ncbi:MAG: hypothetical protein AB8E15_00140 [Bdellovibrionales bacterium]
MRKVFLILILFSSAYLSAQEVVPLEFNKKPESKLVQELNKLSGFYTERIGDGEYRVIKVGFELIRGMKYFAISAWEQANVKGLLVLRASELTGSEMRSSELGRHLSLEVLIESLDKQGRLQTDFELKSGYEVNQRNLFFKISFGAVSKYTDRKSDSKAGSTGKRAVSLSWVDDRNFKGVSHKNKAHINMSTDRLSPSQITQIDLQFKNVPGAAKLVDFYSQSVSNSIVESFSSCSAKYNR